MPLDVRAVALTLQPFGVSTFSELVRAHHRARCSPERIDLAVPGEELAVTHGSNVHGSKQDLDEGEWVKQFDVEGMRKHLRLVIKEAFDVARRRLQDYARRRRHAVKRHEKPLQGKERFERLPPKRRQSARD